MRRGLLCPLLFCLMLAGVILPGRAGAVANEAPDPIAQYHCAGYFPLAVDTNLAALNQAFALSTASRVRALAVSRVSKMISDELGLKTNESVTPLVDPLLSDILDAESLGSFGSQTNGALNFILALRLDADRAQLWQNSFNEALGVPAEKIKVDGFDGCRWIKERSDSYWMTAAKDWLIVGRGGDFLPLRDKYLHELKSHGRPAPRLGDKWLEADIDWVRMGASAPAWVQLFKAARMKLDVASENNGLKLTAHLHYPEDIPWKFDARPKPKYLVGSPLVSFSAGQDVGAYLNMGPDFSGLPGNPLTNQFCAWALAQLPFESYMVWPEVDASNVLAELSTKAVTAFSPALKQFNGTELAWLAEANVLELSNLRVIEPALGAINGTNSEYLMLILFPPPAGKPVSPKGLWEQIDGRKNLVYYDWEETAARLQQWVGLGPMILAPSRAPSPYIGRARSLETKWRGELRAVEGQTVTEATRTAPNELTVARHGPLGLTAIEIFLLSDWLSAVGAPPHSTHAPPP